MRALPHLPVLVLLACFSAALAPRDARAQEVSIPAAVALIGGGLAVTISNGVRAAKGLPPEDLWDDAGWLLGGLNLAIGTAFIIDAGVSTEPIWGALPIGVALATLGVACLTTTTLVVVNAPDQNDDWLLTPALYQDRDGAFAPGVALSLPSF